LRAPLHLLSSGLNDGYVVDNTSTVVIIEHNSKNRTRTKQQQAISSKHGHLYPSQNTREVWEDIVQAVVWKALKQKMRPLYSPQVKLLGGSSHGRENKDDGASTAWG
jgi:hypothetical protein